MKSSKCHGYGKCVVSRKINIDNSCQLSGVLCYIMAKRRFLNTTRTHIAISINCKYLCSTEFDHEVQNIIWFSISSSDNPKSSLRCHSYITILHLDKICFVDEDHCQIKGPQFAETTQFQFYVSAENSLEHSREGGELCCFAVCSIWLNFLLNCILSKNLPLRNLVFSKCIHNT